MAQQRYIGSGAYLTCKRGQHYLLSQNGDDINIRLEGMKRLLKLWPRVKQFVRSIKTGLDADHEFRTVIWNDYQLSTGVDVGEDEIGGLHEKLELLVHAGGFIFLNTARLTGAETRKVVHLVEIGISLTNCDRFERYLHEWNEKYKSELSKLREMKKQQQWQW